MQSRSGILLLLCAFTACNLYMFLNDSRHITDLQQHPELQALEDNDDESGHLPRPQRISKAEETAEPKQPRAIVKEKAGPAPIPLLKLRTCGSPAIDGYSHVVPSCLEASPTAKWWNTWTAGGGKPEDLVVHIEKEADYDGLAVGWGINNKKQNAEECAEACRNHIPGPHVGGPFQNLPCNAFCWCPLENEVCFEPDAHKHTAGDCWLKFTEAPANPEVNFRGAISPEQRKRHPVAPQRVQWTAGVLLPPGTPLGNGTFGPRYHW